MLGIKREDSHTFRYRGGLEDRLTGEITVQSQTLVDRAGEDGPTKVEEITISVSRGECGVTEAPEEYIKARIKGPGRLRGLLNSIVRATDNIRDPG